MPATLGSMYDRHSDDGGDPGERGRYQVRGVDQGPRRGPHLGPFRITPVRLTLLVAFAGGLGFLAYSVLIRDQLQVPLMASGFAICGLVFAASAIIAVPAVMQAGREGRDATAVLTALVGGLLALAAFLSFAAAVIMSLIWRGSSTA